MAHRGVLRTASNRCSQATTSRNVLYQALPRMSSSYASPRFSRFGG
jgi:hypothetical protein